MIKTLVSRGILRKIGVFAAVFLGGFCFSLDSFADTGLDFSVNVSDTPILEINLSDANGSAIGATTTMDVVPDHGMAAFNEKTMVVSVGTNNEWGYNLVMSVSNTSLVSTEDNTKTIPTLASKEGGYTCTVATASSCDFTANTWGYKLNTATNLSAATNYLPLQSSITLNNNTSKVLTPEATSVAFGSKVNADLAPGTYQTTINFAATANPDPTPIMQNITTSTLASLMPNDGSTTTLKDSRDGNRYQITNINGTYWMTSNLKIMGTISASESNFTGADFNISAGGDLTAGNTYTEPRAHYNTSDTNSATYGAYYNYCAASAGTVCDNSTKQNATSDICPKGWRLPTQTEAQAFANASSSNKNPVLAGYYYSSSVLFTASLNGFWWLATAYDNDTYYQYYLRYDGSSWSVDSYFKHNGRSVRCVYGPLPTMQNVTSAKLAALMPNDGDVTTLLDSRDGNNYNIAKIGNTYWMTDNLKIAGTVSAAGSNFTGEDVSIDGNIRTYTEPGSTYYDDIYGTYYNYCAASAGTICNSSTKQNATVDICPKGWRLPTQTDAENFIYASSPSKNPVLSGYFSGEKGEVGYWWLADAMSKSTQYLLQYKKNSWGISAGMGAKNYGYPIRCIFYGG